MKKKNSAVIGMLAVCFMMMAAGAAWSRSPAVVGVNPPPRTVNTLNNNTNVNTLNNYVPVTIIAFDGTVRDGGLVWLKNANCFGKLNWNDAMSKAASLKSGMCGLTDGSTAGQWRLPTKDELVRRQKNQVDFNNVQADAYWSSSRLYANCAWIVHMNNVIEDFGTLNYRGYVWPVRAGR